MSIEYQEDGTIDLQDEYDLSRKVTVPRGPRADQLAQIEAFFAARTAPPTTP